MALTVLECQHAKPGKHHDGAGLFLIVRAGGKRSWRLRFRPPGEAESSIVIGAYPAMGPKEARDEVVRIREQLAAGVHPGRERRDQALAQVEQARAERADRERKRIEREGKLFCNVADSWHAAMVRDNVWKKKTAEQAQGRFDNYVNKSSLWQTPIDEITVADVSALLNSVHDAKPATAPKVRQLLNGVFGFAIGRGMLNASPVTHAKIGSGRRARKRVQAKRRQPAVLDILEAGEILRRTEASLQVTADMADALRLMALTAQRNSNVVGMRWADLDLAHARWIIPREQMKVDDPERGDHVVPLSTHAMTLLQRRKKERGSSPYVFASSATSGHLTIEGPSACYKRALGLDGVMVPHGWRSCFSTNANNACRVDESGFAVRLFDAADIEAVLDHGGNDEVAAAYRRDRALARMKTILQWWGDALARAEGQAGARAKDKRPVPVTRMEREACEVGKLKKSGALSRFERELLGVHA